MRIDVEQVAHAVKFAATLGEGDRETHAGASLARNEATFRLYDGIYLDQVHPDLIALAALTCFYPWIGGRRLEMASPVSRHFAETVKTRAKIEITNVSHELQPRTAQQGARPGLSFSAGVDSLAALAVMPDNTVPMYAYRSTPPDRPAGMYRADAALHAIEQMNRAGKRTYLVESDLEWVRGPVGFPVDPSPATALVLLADSFNLDAIAFGTIAEAAYRTGTEHFIDYALRGVFTMWQAIFRAVGIEYYNCVAPLSEMGTTKIARESRYGHLAQSCVRGLPGQPCQNCVKCFRKSLIEASFSGDWPDRADVSRMMANRSIKGYLSTTPIRLQIILMATLARYEGSDPLLQALRDYVGATEVDTSFTHAWYGPGIDDMVPSSYRPSTIAALNRHVPKMTDQQEADFQAFDIRPLVARKQETGAAEEFLHVLEENSATPSR